MNYSHYGDLAVRLAVDLVNTLDTVKGVDGLADLADLEAFVNRVGLDDAPAAPTQADLEGVRSLRRLVRQVFEASDVERAAAAVNQILEDSKARPYISTHQNRPHLHVEPRRAGLTRWLGAVVGMGLASVIIDQGTGRFGVCQAPDCRDVYIDLSRNRSRKHCSDACTNRESVRSFRRRAGSGQQPA